jgi:hypothetical protein
MISNKASVNIYHDAICNAQEAVTNKRSVIGNKTPPSLTEKSVSKRLESKCQLWPNLQKKRTGGVAFEKR